MNGGPSQADRVLIGAFADKIPANNMEDGATRLWIEADRFTTADGAQVVHNQMALREARDKIDAALTKWGLA